jgi:DNA polymerase-3 subunit epsilon
MSTRAIIDVETTGINPWHHQRIIEIGVVVMRSDGEIVGELCSLIDPDRDIGPTSVH